MISARKLVEDFSALDPYFGRIPGDDGTSKIDAVKVRETVHQVWELAKKHKIAVLYRNQSSPEGAAGTFSLYREDWHNTIRFLPNIEQFRFPRSKKKRIRKKWSMKPANWRRKREPRFFVSKARPRKGSSMRFCVERGSDPVFLPMRDHTTGENQALRMSRSMYHKITDALVQAKEAGQLAQDINIKPRSDGKGFEVTSEPITQ